MRSEARRLCMVVVLAGLGIGRPAEAKLPVLPPRPGQIGVGVQGQFGMMVSKTGDLGVQFDNGPGLAVRLRYRMRYERGVGLSFEGQTFDVRRGRGDDTLTTLKLVTSGIEFYQMFGTRTTTTRMLSAGAGVAQVSRKYTNGDLDYPGDGVYVSAGAGLERFFYRTWAYDLSARYMTLFQQGKANHQVQLSAGLIFYAN